MRCNLHDYDIMEEGKLQAKLEAARNMLMENVPIDKIANWQDLPLETVQQLAEELAKDNNKPVQKLQF